MIADLASYPDRCSRGFHLVAQHPALCDCQPDNEWDLFVTVLRSAARDGRVHQSAVRPLLRGRMQAKHIGLAYRRAIREGLIREVTREQSDDEHGRNTNKWEPVYQLRSAS